MSRAQSPVLFLLFAVAVSGCSQQGSSPQNPGQFGVAPAVARADLFPYRFTGGSGSAHFTAKGKDGTCSGTLKFSGDNVVYVDVKSNGDVDPGVLSTATLTGSSSCDGNPFLFPEVFDLKSGSIKSDKVNDVKGTPPSTSIFGTFTMTGTVCDATVHLGRFIAAGDGSRVQIDSVTIAGLQKTTGC